MANVADMQEIADKQAITDLIYRYCRAMDRIDHALGYSIWHEDGMADYGADTFQGTGRDFIDWVCASHRHVDAHSHQVTNVMIDLAGDRAGSEAYVTANLRMERDGKPMQMTVWSRYIDRWSKRGGRWGIDKRVTVIDFDEVREVTPMKKTSPATRDRDDPSYAALAGV